MLYFKLVVNDYIRCTASCAEDNTDAADSLLSVGYVRIVKKEYDEAVICNTDTKPEEPEQPSQLDVIEAQTMYTALMTGTLIEEDESNV